MLPVNVLHQGKVNIDNRADCNCFWLSVFWKKIMLDLKISILFSLKKWSFVMSLKGALERVSIFQISEFGKEEKKMALFLPFPSPTLILQFTGPKVPGRKVSCSFGHFIWSESKQALLYVSLKSILLHTLVKVQPLAGSLACPIVLNLMFRTSISVN